MGYRSEVGILITVPKRIKPETMVKKLFSKWKANELKDCFKITYFEEFGSKFVYAYCSWIKWYAETFEDEKATMHFINNYGYKTGGIHFVRWGEDYDDVEEIIVGKPQKWLQFERRIWLQRNLNYERHS